MKSIITFERLLWLGVIIFAILFFKKCGGRVNSRIISLQQEAKELKQKHDRDSIAFAARIALWQDSMSIAGMNSDLQVKVIKETEQKLQSSQSTISRLTSIIRNDQFAHNLDSQYTVRVSSQYKAACDSLPAEIDKQNEVIGQLHKDNEGLVDLMNYEVVYRDSLIEAGKEYTDRLRGFYNAQARLLTAALNEAKPRGRLLGGIGLIGNELNPLSGTKINLAYQSKGGKQYQVGGILMRGGVYYEATVLITLIK